MFEYVSERQITKAIVSNFTKDLKKLQFCFQNPMVSMFILF